MQTKVYERASTSNKHVSKINQRMCLMSLSMHRCNPLYILYMNTFLIFAVMYLLASADLFVCLFVSMCLCLVLLAPVFCMYYLY